MKRPDPITVRHLLEAPCLGAQRFQVLAGEASLDSQLITNPRIQKPGLALAGYFAYIKPGRVQIVGASEYDYLGTLDRAEMVDRWFHLVDSGIPLVISAKGLVPPAEVLERCDELDVPFVVTQSATSVTISKVSLFLERELAPYLQLHGVLMDVFSLGTLIVGDAGIGKSECALDLVHRGHRLVADDIVVVRHTHGEGLVGTPHPRLENFLELRGVGIIDVRKHFGMTATTPSVRISLMIRLVKLSDETRAMERRWREQLMTNPAPWTSTHDILGMEVPLFTMAVAPGRDVAIMVETAVTKCLLANRGVDDERAFIESVNRRAEGMDSEELSFDDL